MVTKITSSTCLIVQFIYFYLGTLGICSGVLAQEAVDASQLPSGWTEVREAATPRPLAVGLNDREGAADVVFGDDGKGARNLPSVQSVGRIDRASSIDMDPGAFRSL